MVVRRCGELGRADVERSPEFRRGWWSVAGPHEYFIRLGCPGGFEVGEGLFEGGNDSVCGYAVSDSYEAEVPSASTAALGRTLCEGGVPTGHSVAPQGVASDPILVCDEEGQGGAAYGSCLYGYEGAIPLEEEGVREDRRRRGAVLSCEELYVGFELAL